MCYSVNASIGAFAVGSAAVALALRRVGDRLGGTYAKYYRYVLFAWAYVNLMQIADLLTWLSLRDGHEAPWNGPLTFALNVGQPVAVAAAVSAAAGSIAPSVAVTTGAFAALAAYVGATTELTVSPVAPSERLSYSWWNGDQGPALAVLYAAAMGAATLQAVEPLRKASFLAGAATYGLALVMASDGTPGARASVWCIVGAVVGPAAVGIAASV